MKLHTIPLGAVKQVAVAILLLTVSYALYTFFGIGATGTELFLLPIFAGFAGDSFGCDTPDSGCSNGADGLGDAGAGDAGAGDGGGADGGGTSTPFLCLWNGEKFVFENEILNGEPGSFSKRIAAARDAFYSGKMGQDLYNIRRHKVLEENGKIRLQIREIEPEESYINSVTLKKVIAPKGSELFVDSKMQRYWSFNKHEVLKGSGLINQKVFDNEQNDISTSMAQNVLVETTGLGKFFSKNDVFHIKAKVANKKKKSFLLIHAAYRDYGAGTIMEFEKGQKSLVSAPKKIASPFMSFVRQGTRVCGVLAVAGFVWVASSLGFTTGKEGGEENKIAEFVKSYSPVAFADTGHSLYVFHVNSAGHTELIGIVHPRYWGSNLAIEIPENAYDEEGNVELRIVATSKHEVQALQIFTPETINEATEVEYSLESAIHSRFASNFRTELSSSGDRDEVQLYPADTLTMDFVSTKEKTKEEDNLSVEYLLTTKGYFGPASAKVQASIGNWIKKLDDDSYNVIKDIYQLRNRV